MQARNRRWFLRAAGATIATAAIAGCVGDDGSDDEDAWADVSEITLEGYSTGWVGVSPDVIADEENPTLVLQEGEEYTIEWINGDNLAHDMEIQDSDATVLHETETVETEDESTSVTFEATAEMTAYECSYHRGIQRGDIEIN